MYSKYTKQLKRHHNGKKLSVYKYYREQKHVKHSKFLRTRNMVPGETAKNDYFSLNEID